jgi:hypothetical protein
MATGRVLRRSGRVWEYALARAIVACGAQVSNLCIALLCNMWPRELLAMARCRPPHSRSGHLAPCHSHQDSTRHGGGARLHLVAQQRRNVARVDAAKDRVDVEHAVDEDVAQQLRHQHRFRGDDSLRARRRRRCRKALVGNLGLLQLPNCKGHNIRAQTAGRLEIGPKRTQVACTECEIVAATWQRTCQPNKPKGWPSGCHTFQGVNSVGLHTPRTLNSCSRSRPGACAAQQLQIPQVRCCCCCCCKAAVQAGRARRRRRRRRGDALERHPDRDHICDVADGGADDGDDDVLPDGNAPPRCSAARPLSARALRYRHAYACAAGIRRRSALVRASPAQRSVRAVCSLRCQVPHWMRTVPGHGSALFVARACRQIVGCERKRCLQGITPTTRCAHDDEKFAKVICVVGRAMWEVEHTHGVGEVSRPGAPAAGARAARLATDVHPFALLRYGRDESRSIHRDAGAARHMAPSAAGCQ